MDQASLTRPCAASVAAVRPDTDESAGVRSDIDWFSAMARAVHPHKPGTNLHLTTGVDERLCKKYAAGSVRPSSSLLRALLRSPLGWEYLDALMEGCVEPWWIEVQRARRIADALRGID